MEEPSGTKSLDRAAVRAIDRRAIEEYGIPGIVLMENAAIGLHAHLRAMVGAPGRRAAKVTIVCGRGNNGGDGWALARHAANSGDRVEVVALGHPAPGTDAEVNQRIAVRMGIDVAEETAGRFETSDLIVDAIFGTGLTREVTGRAADWIDRINDAGTRVLAVDVPSGLDCDSGRPLGTAVRATRTVTFVAPKVGFGRPSALEYLGELHVVGIGAPTGLVRSGGRATGESSNP